MENFAIGDLVVLTSGSMRMAVEGTDGTAITCVWCHEGQIGRDSFDARLLRKWEHKEEDKSAGRGDRGDRDARRGRGPGGDRGDRGDRDDKPFRGKPGWDGKPREKRFFRKDT